MCIEGEGLVKKLLLIFPISQNKIGFGILLSNSRIPFLIKGTLLLGVIFHGQVLMKLGNDVICLKDFC